MGRPGSGADTFYHFHDFLGTIKFRVSADVRMTLRCGRFSIDPCVLEQICARRPNPGPEWVEDCAGTPNFQILGVTKTMIFLIKAFFNTFGGLFFQGTAHFHKSAHPARGGAVWGSRAPSTPRASRPPFLWGWGLLGDY